MIGCSKQLSFNELIINEPSDLNLKAYSSAKMKYRMSLLDKLTLVETDYYGDTLASELFIDTSLVFDEDVSLLSISRYNSNNTELQKEWKKLISNRKVYENFSIFSEGITDYLNKTSYYEHSAYFIGRKKKKESIIFLFRGNSSDFYLISIDVNAEEGYPDNLKELLFCVKSIKIG